MATASRNHNALYGCLADQARLAFAAIDPVLRLEETFLTISIHVIGDRRAPEGDRFLKHFLDRSIKSSKLFPRKTGRWPSWPDSGPEQRFIRVDVAHATQQLLIQQCTFDGSLASAEQCHKLLPVNIEWFETTRFEITVA